MTGDRVVRACCAGSAAFVAAALVVGALNALSPFQGGWWLASDLPLVGGVSRLLLGGGLLLVAARLRAVPPARRLSGTQLALCNIGTAAVAVADMARVVQTLGFPAVGSSATGERAHASAKRTPSGSARTSGGARSDACRCWP